MSLYPLAEESIPPGEVEFTKDLAARLQAKIIRDNPTGIMRRDAHPKMHGVVKAEFIIEPDLAPELRIGIFQQAKTFQAWVRFSNQDGTISPDTGRDIRGMAIKLMGVAGEKILDAEKEAQTQDFIVISTPIFITKDVEEFDNLIKALTGSFFAKLGFFIGHFRVALNLLKSMRKFANPLHIRYFSTTPYLFGSSAVKYCATPHVVTPCDIPQNPSDDYLRLAMMEQLMHGDAHFDFSVQLQTNTRTMPIEDAGHAWSEEESPFRKVATIRILQQEFNSEQQRTFGENLSFSPWHCLPAHRPLGGINRARKVVYNAISTFRHEYNHVVRKEPVSWDIQ